MKGKKEKIEEAEEQKLFKIEGVLSEKGVLVSLDYAEDLAARGFGREEDGEFTLNCYEALFLTSKAALEVTTKKRKQTLDFQELLDEFKSVKENVWANYLIYRDLRSRGYVAREGFGLGINFRVYERGEYGKATAKYLILGIQEGKPVSMTELTSIQNHTQSLKKKLVLAVVNRRGEIVYYTLSKLAMKNS